MILKKTHWHHPGPSLSYPSLSSSYGSVVYCYVSVTCGCHLYPVAVKSGRDEIKEIQGAKSGNSPITNLYPAQCSCYMSWKSESSWSIIPRHPSRVVTVVVVRVVSKKSSKWLKKHTILVMAVTAVRCARYLWYSHCCHPALSQLSLPLLSLWCSRCPMSIK